jgi:GT2 family glycosyltransferase
MSKNRNRDSVSKPQAQIDVCILEAGRFDMLEKCLDALYHEAQLVPLNIYIFDNGSDAKERLAHTDLLTYQPAKDPAKGVVNFQVKRSQQNLGFPVGSNEAAKMGRAPLIMFLGDDVELKPGAIEQVVQDFKDTSVGVVGIKLLFPLTSTDRNRPAGRVQHVGMGVDIHGNPIHPLVGWSADNPKCGVSRDVWAVTGACFTIRRGIFNKLGGFDPIYGLGTHEDLDLCMKVRASGQRVYFDAKAQGYHFVGATAEKLQVGFPLQQNRSIFMARWQNSGQVFWNEVEWW